MSNVQQPEMRRSGHDPLVTSSKQESAQGSLPRGSSSASGSRSRSGKDTRPTGQKSRYGPEGTGQDRVGSEARESHGRTGRGRKRS